MQGTRVFAYLEAADEWHPAVVRMVHRTDCLSISYDNPQLTRIDNDASAKPTSAVRPDVVHPQAGGGMGVGHPHGEEDDDDTKAAAAALMVGDR